MSSRTDKKKLRLVIDGFLLGDSVQYRIIMTKITQYVYHQDFGAGLDRDEIASEILDILYRNLKNKKFKGDSISALNVYIYSIIRHRIYRVLRRRARETATDDSILHLEEDHSPDPSQKAEASDLAEKVFDRLDVKCRELLNLKYQECWSDQEIADHIKKSKNATSTAISRCLGKARELDVVKELL